MEVNRPASMGMLESIPMAFEAWRGLVTREHVVAREQLVASGAPLEANWAAKLLNKSSTISAESCAIAVYEDRMQRPLPWAIEWPTHLGTKLVMDV